MLKIVNAHNAVGESKDAQNAVGESKDAHNAVGESKDAHNAVGESKDAHDAVGESNAQPVVDRYVSFALFYHQYSLSFILLPCQ